MATTTTEPRHAVPTESKAPAGLPTAPQSGAEATSHATIQWSCSPRGVAFGLGAVTLMLTLCHLATVYYHFEIEELPWEFRSLFDLDEEASFGTWFSSGILFLAGMGAMLCALRAKATGAGLRFQWWALGAGFALLSLDEVAGMHESVNSVTESSWAIPGGILAGLVGLSFLPFLARIPRPTAALFVLGGAIYLGGAVGVELGTEGFLQRDELNTLEYNLWTAVEEFMEMAGIVVFLFAVVAFLAVDDKLQLSVAARPE